MSDTHVVLQGWVGSNPETSTAGDSTVTEFRVASTRRYRDRSGDYRDGETTWYDVKAWRTLGENVARSVRKGDPVMVRGRLKSDVWQRDDGSRSTSLVVDATCVGHDLNRGTAAFLRAPRREHTTDRATTAAGEPGDPWSTGSASASAPAPGVDSGDEVTASVA